MYIICIIVTRLYYSLSTKNKSVKNSTQIVMQADQSQCLGHFSMHSFEFAGCMVLPPFLQ